MVGKNTYSFLKNDDTWNYSGDPNFPADADKIENLLSAFSEVSASRVLTDVSDLAQYGLEEPANTIHLTDSEGGEYVLHIGNLNSSTGDYYAYTSDEKTVYTIDSTIPLDFQIGLYDLAKTESFPSIDSTEVSLVEVTSEERPVLCFIRTHPATPAGFCQTAVECTRETTASVIPAG